MKLPAYSCLVLRAGARSLCANDHRFLPATTGATQEAQSNTNTSSVLLFVCMYVSAHGYSPVTCQCVTILATHVYSIRPAAYPPFYYPSSFVLNSTQTSSIFFNKHFRVFFFFLSKARKRNLINSSIGLVLHCSYLKSLGDEDSQEAFFSMTHLSWSQLSETVMVKKKIGSYSYRWCRKLIIEG